MRQQFDDFDDSQSSDQELKSDRKTSPFEFLAVLGLIGGLLGYGVYQEFVEPITAANAKKASPSPSPTKSALPKLPDPTGTAPRPESSLAKESSAPIAPPLPSTSPLASEPTLATEIYQRAPKNGVYYAQNSLLNASRREIASSNGRFCIKLVNGPVPPESGQEQVVVSSLSFQNNGVYVDATGEKLQFDRTYTELTDGRGVWQLLEGKGDRTGASAECLNTSGSFVREEKGETGQSR